VQNGGVCYSQSVEKAYAGSQTWSAAGVLLVVVATLALVLSSLGFLCVRFMSGTSNTNGTSISISDSVDKLRELSKGLHNGTKKSGVGGAGASYRKLSDDTERLVTSNKPFYDFPSSDEEEEQVL
jgi:hypothetical protein